jgi:outer membrane protein OmpA-like peptidoglycan-associated protein
MKIFYASLLLIALFMVPAHSQENPKINKEQLISASGEVGEAFIEEKLSEGDRFYRDGYYEGSYRAYIDLYEVTSESAPLNYKLGVSALMGGQPDQASKYLEESLPSVADDYYLLLGYAYRAELKFSRAREAFQNYNNTLPGWKKKQFRSQFNQLLNECEFGERNANDSVPAFVFNMGPAVNSYYDEYAAAEDPQHDRIFFTTRRPDRLPDIPVGRENFEERVLEAAFVNGEASEGVEVGRLNSRFNTAVSGLSPDKESLYLYEGKKSGGHISVSDISGKKAKRPKNLGGRIDHKLYKETTFTETEDGVVFFVSDHRKGKGGKDIWTVKRRGKSRFSKPKNLTALNTDLDEEAVYVTPDGSTLYFASEGHPGFGGFDIYKSEKNRDGDWMMPVNIGQPYNSGYDDLFYFPTSDSLTVFVASSRAGGFGGLDLYKIKKDIRIPFTIAGEITEKTSENPLYAKVTVVDTIKHEPVQSAWTDSLTGEYLIALEDTGSYQLQVSAEGFKMTLTSIINPQQRDAVLTEDFVLEKLKHPYTIKGSISDVDTREPVQAEIAFKPLGSDSIAHRIFSDEETGSYSITFEDKSNMQMEVTAHHYYRQTFDMMLKNTLGDSEVKDIEMEKSLKEYTLSGKVVEEKTNDAVPAELAVYEPGAEEALLVAYADSTTGNYSFTVYQTGPFLVEVNADGYFFNNLSVQFNPDSTLKVQNITLQPMLTGARIVAEDILFTSGKATLMAKSYPELNRLVRLLNENPSIRIEVSGHTDNTGSASLNKKLSKSRALSVKRYLESQGIDPDRIEYEGYGFDQPIVPNTTPEGRAKNRRVEIKVIG